MCFINHTFRILAVILITTPLYAYADSWSCSRGNDVREVHIELTTSSPVPCHVVYKKQTEGFDDRVLWSANNDDSFCDEKAQALVAKLESSQWVCTETVKEEKGEATETEPQ